MMLSNAPQSPNSPPGNPTPVFSNVMRLAAAHDSPQVMLAQNELTRIINSSRQRDTEMNAIVENLQKMYLQASTNMRNARTRDEMNRSRLAQYDAEFAYNKAAKELGRNRVKWQLMIDQASCKVDLATAEFKLTNAKKIAEQKNNEKSIEVGKLRLASVAKDRKLGMARTPQERVVASKEKFFATEGYDKAATMFGAQKKRFELDIARKNAIVDLEVAILSLNNTRLEYLLIDQQTVMDIEIKEEKIKHKTIEQRKRMTADMQRSLINEMNTLQAEVKDMQAKLRWKRFKDEVHISVLTWAVEWRRAIMLLENKRYNNLVRDQRLVAPIEDKETYLKRLKFEISLEQYPAILARLEGDVKSLTAEIATMYVKLNKDRMFAEYDISKALSHARWIKSIMDREKYKYDHLLEYETIVSQTDLARVALDRVKANKPNDNDRKGLERWIVGLHRSEDALRHRIDTLDNRRKLASQGYKNAEALTSLNKIYHLKASMQVEYDKRNTELDTAMNAVRQEIQKLKHDLSNGNRHESKEQIEAVLQIKEAKQQKLKQISQMLNEFEQVDNQLLNAHVLWLDRVVKLEAEKYVQLAETQKVKSHINNFKVQLERLKASAPNAANAATWGTYRNQVDHLEDEIKNKQNELNRLEALYENTTKQMTDAIKNAKDIYDELKNRRIEMSNSRKDEEAYEKVPPLSMVTEEVSIDPTDIPEVETHDVGTDEIKTEEVEGDDMNKDNHNNQNDYTAETNAKITTSDPIEDTTTTKYHTEKNNGTTQNINESKTPPTADAPVSTATRDSSNQPSTTDIEESTNNSRPHHDLPPTAPSEAAKPDTTENRNGATPSSVIPEEDTDDSEEEGSDDESHYYEETDTPVSTATRGSSNQPSTTDIEESTNNSRPHHDLPPTAPSEAAKPDTTENRNGATPSSVIPEEDTDDSEEEGSDDESHYYEETDTPVSTATRDSSNQPSTTDIEESTNNSRPHHDLPPTAPSEAAKPDTTENRNGATPSSVIPEEDTDDSEEEGSDDESHYYEETDTPVSTATRGSSNQPSTTDIEESTNNSRPHHDLPPTAPSEAAKPDTTENRNGATPSSVIPEEDTDDSEEEGSDDESHYYEETDTPVSTATRDSSNQPSTTDIEESTNNSRPHHDLPPTAPSEAAKPDTTENRNGATPSSVIPEEDTDDSEEEGSDDESHYYEETDTPVSDADSYKPTNETLAPTKIHSSRVAVDHDANQGDYCPHEDPYASDFDFDDSDDTPFDCSTSVEGSSINPLNGHIGSANVDHVPDAHEENSYGHGKSGSDVITPETESVLNKDEMELSSDDSQLTSDPTDASSNTNHEEDNNKSAINTLANIKPHDERHGMSPSDTSLPYYDLDDENDDDDEDVDYSALHPQSDDDNKIIEDENDKEAFHVEPNTNLSTSTNGVSNLGNKAVASQLSTPKVSDSPSEKNVNKDEDSTRRKVSTGFKVAGGVIGFLVLTAIGAATYLKKKKPVHTDEEVSFDAYDDTDFDRTTRVDTVVTLSDNVWE
uniref:Uncharacterized protein n=2 Tax=Babesia bovis TaxID=5865 RepID=A7AWR9_BABBO|eukprot:XP_001609065.1 hypothetical protein [Babesia bovis T2Bo]